MSWKQSFHSRGRNALSLFALGVPAAIVASCSGDRHGQAGPEALMQASRDWSRAAAAGRIDATVDYWADDAIVIMPGLPTLRGKAAIREYVEQSLKTPGFRISWEPLEGHLSTSGDVGYLLERSSVTMPNATGKLETQQFRVVTIWRKGADGRWRNVVDGSIP